MSAAAVIPAGGVVLDDDLLRLAFSVYAAKGAYAVLLGSGVSRAAGLPTGWEVVLTLLRRVAAVEGVDPEGDTEEWWRGQTGEQPSYSGLLDRLTSTPQERAGLLREFFEPTAEESEQGIKQPTRAHRALARLVRDGYVKVIVTTNFDRLMERALSEEGVEPVVISTPEAAHGASPLSHNRCTVVKVHGDYLDSDVKNTATELASYDQRMLRLLEKVLDEYGLITCGWSADWDEALRRAMEATPPRRFGAFWAARHGAMSETAGGLAIILRATVISIEDADQFFTLIEEKLAALERVKAQDPLNSEIAVAALKRYLPDPARRIDLDDLVRRHVEEAISRTSLDKLPLGSRQLTPEDVMERLAIYEESCRPVMGLFAHGAYYGDESQISVWTRALDRLLNMGKEMSGITIFIGLQRYPALLCLYAAGTAAVAAERFGFLGQLVQIPQLRKDESGKPQSGGQALTDNRVFRQRRRIHQAGSWTALSRARAGISRRRHVAEPAAAATRPG